MLLVQQLERLSLQDGQHLRSLRPRQPKQLPLLQPHLRHTLKAQRPLRSRPRRKLSQDGRPLTHSLRSLSRRRPALQQLQQERGAKPGS